MASHESYTLRVTAGPSYDPETQSIVPVNAKKTLTIESEHGVVELCVRIKDYNGLPRDSPRTSEYFSHPDHQSDLYSIAISFVPKHTVTGSDLVFGNDFDHPIRDRLPPGTNYAIGIVKWMIDPGIEGDAYADCPYLYGPALSSWNIFRICERSTETLKRDQNGGALARCSGPGDEDPDKEDTLGSLVSTTGLHEEIIEEGAEGSGKEVRQNLDIPSDAKSRKKFFLTESNRESFQFEAGRRYKADFANPYLGFSDLSIRLPGFSLGVANFIDRKNHCLRYVLKNKSTGDIYFVVAFTLLLDYEDDDGSPDGSDVAQEALAPEESEVD